MTFREFLQISEGMWGSRGQFATGLTKKTAPKKDMYNSPIEGQGRGVAPAAAMPGRMKRMKKEHSTFGQNGNEFGIAPTSPMGITGPSTEKPMKKLTPDVTFGMKRPVLPRLQATKNV